MRRPRVTAAAAQTDQLLVDNLIRSVCENFRPRDPVSVSEWQEIHRVMEPGAAKKGRWRCYEFQKEIFDAILDPDCSQLTIKFCSQLLGKSAILTGITGYIIAEMPTSILNVHPTDNGASHYCRNRLNPMIAETPVLRSLIVHTTARRQRIGAGEQSVLFKTFPGGWYLAGGSNSPAQLRAHSARVTIFDETSAFVQDVGEEGDPILLVRQRSAKFEDAFSISASTPGVAGMCRITTEFETSDMRFWHVPCVHCGHDFVIRWANLIWPKDRDQKGHVIRHHIEDAQIQCPICSKLISDPDRMDMVKAGKWIATNPEVTNHRGYAGDCFLALGPVKRGFKSWLHYFASRFFEAERLGPPGRKTFLNLLLNEVWEPEAEKPPEYQKIYDRRELYHEDADGIVLPDRVLFLVCGCDVQQDRIEAEILGVGRLGEHYGIEYKIFRGNTETPQIFQELDAWIQTPFRHMNGHKLAVACTVVDSGNLPTQIYQYSYRSAPRPVYCGKGVRGFESQWVTRSQGKYQRLFLLKVDGAKSALYSRLNITEFGPGFQHVPANDRCGYDATWCQQLVSEVLRTTYQSGRAIKFFTKTSSGIRNEALDARIQALAAIEVLNPNFDAIERSLRNPPLHDWRESAPATPAEPPAEKKDPMNAPVRPPPPPRRRSGWRSIY